MNSTYTITLHDTSNSGSSLQAFALNRFLNMNGVNNLIIDYVPHYFINEGHPVKSFLRNSLFVIYRIRNLRKYKNFKDNYLMVTKEKYSNLAQLRNNPPEGECYITGSDQLWNDRYACGKDPAFYLDFGKTSVKRISYAISLGKDVISESTSNNIKKYCSPFKWISVREKDSIHAIKSILPEKKIEFVADPVLLLKPDVYTNMMSQRIIKEKYVLIYIAQPINKELINRYLRIIREDIGAAKIVFIGSYTKKCNSDIHIRSFGPLDFLSLINYAELVISNSYHATLFSTILKKQHMTFVPAENGARIMSFFDVCGMDRGIYGNELRHPIICSEDDLLNIQKRAILFGEKSGKRLLEIIKS